MSQDYRNLMLAFNIYDSIDSQLQNLPYCKKWSKYDRVRGWSITPLLIRSTDLVQFHARAASFAVQI